MRGGRTRMPAGEDGQNARAAPWRGKASPASGLCPHEPLPFPTDDMCIRSTWHTKRRARACRPSRDRPLGSARGPAAEPLALTPAQAGPAPPLGCAPASAATKRPASTTARACVPCPTTEPCARPPPRRAAEGIREGRWAFCAPVGRPPSSFREVAHSPSRVRRHSRAR